MAWMEYLARLIGRTPQSERELSTLSGRGEEYVRGNLDRMVSFEAGGLNRAANDVTQGYGRPYLKSITAAVNFLYVSHTGEMIHFGDHPHFSLMTHIM